MSLIRLHTLSHAIIMIIVSNAYYDRVFFLSCSDSNSSLLFLADTAAIPDVKFLLQIHTHWDASEKIPGRNTTGSTWPWWQSLITWGRCCCCLLLMTIFLHPIFYRERHPCGFLGRFTCGVCFKLTCGLSPAKAKAFTLLLPGPHWPTCTIIILCKMLVCAESVSTHMSVTYHVQLLPWHLP